MNHRRQPFFLSVSSTQEKLPTTAGKSTVVNGDHNNMTLNHNCNNEIPNFLSSTPHPYHMMKTQQKHPQPKMLSSIPSCKKNNANISTIRSNKKDIEDDDNNKKKNKNNIDKIKETIFPSPGERMFVKTAKDVDILIGRGKPYQIHPGNRIMRRLVAENKDLYNNSRRDFRKAVALNLLEQITNHGMRFLKRCKTPPQNAFFLNDYNENGNNGKDNKRKNDNNTIDDSIIKEENDEDHKQNGKNSIGVVVSASSRDDSSGSSSEVFFRDGGCWELATKDEACEKLCHALRFKPTPSSSSSSSKTNEPSQSLLARQQQQHINDRHHHHQQQEQHYNQLAHDFGGKRDTIESNNTMEERGNDDTSSIIANTRQHALHDTTTRNNLVSRQHLDQLNARVALLLYDNMKHSMSNLQASSIFQDWLNQQSRLCKEPPSVPNLGQESALVSMLRDRTPNLWNASLNGIRQNDLVTRVNPPSSAVNTNSTITTTAIERHLEELSLLLPQEPRDQHRAILNELIASHMSHCNITRPDHNHQERPQGEILDALKNHVQSTRLEYLVVMLSGTY